MRSWGVLKSGQRHSKAISLSKQWNASSSSSILSFRHHFLLSRYHQNQQYREHYDWFGPENAEIALSGNRVSSFFVYLVTNCTGGTTVFPNVSRPKSSKFCGILKCHDEQGKDVEYLEVEPKAGTAIFWYNLDPAGNTDENTLHAGRPVVEGTKVGMNIWTRERDFRRRVK